MFRRLSAAASVDALLDAVLHLAREHGGAGHACVLLADEQGHRLAALDLPGAAGPARRLAPFGDGALAALPAAVRALLDGRAVAPGDGTLCLPLDGGAGYLCCWNGAGRAIAQGGENTLALVAACCSVQLAGMGTGAIDAWVKLGSHLAGDQNLLRAIIDNMPDHIYIKDTAGRFVIGNKAAALGIGVAAPEDLVGKSDLDFYPNACGEGFFKDEQAIIRSGVPLVDQLEENINMAGIRRWFSTTKMPFRNVHGSVIGIVGMSRDVTLRMQADEAIRLRNRAIEASNDAIVITSSAGPAYPIVYVNPAFERITGFSPREAERRNIADMLGARDGKQDGELGEALAEQREGHAVLQSMRKDGVAFWNDVRLAPVRDKAGQTTHFVYTMTDITKARAAEEQLERLASYDNLTGLPNRRLLMDRLSQAIAMGERGKFVIAVAFIDLDRLKHVNDTMGHDAGDLLLKTVAKRMAACVRKSDTVGRLGGDEFVLLSLHKLGATNAPGDRPAIALADDDYGYVAQMLAKIQRKLAQPIQLGGQAFSVTCSVGVSVYPRDGADAETLLKHADSAMYQAKKNGRNMVAFYASLPADVLNS
ncbi:GGDEF domain-containing protein [Massilia glaciei]|uniref:GGDEF domain-containing protein n=1 Tax=Massilia glaciei TaxID=1524097 RepID=A0A2U2HHJ7_9BURK|nr:GGDEF domain-containing protein [Massilia glaciei]